MKVAVIRGGRSSEHQISLRSGASVAEGLRAVDHQVIDVVIDRRGRWLAEGEELALRPTNGLLGADLAFPVLHGPFGEDGTVQGVLEYLGLPYVGSGVLASAVTIDKLVCKRLLRDRGIPQVDFCQAGNPDRRAHADLGLGDWRDRVAALGIPVWVKPSRLGSSLGIVKVTDPAELDDAVREALAFDPRVIVEAHCPGLEVECSVIGNRVPETSLPGQPVTDADWYDYEAKYEPGGMNLLVPPPVDEATIARVRELAAEVFSYCGCAGLARCDFFVSESGEVLVNEINTLPGFTPTSVFAKLFERSGLPYPRLCERLVELAIERHQRDRAFKY